jgi:hypothetical protein
MARYRSYSLDSNGRISGPPNDFDAGDDIQAIEQAKQFLSGKAVEVWQGARQVGRVYPKATSANSVGTYV